MRNLISIARFEVSQRARTLTTWIFAGILFALGFFWMAAAGGAIPGARVEFGTGGKVFVNSPYSLTMLIALTGHFGTVITAAIAGGATTKDVENRTTALFYTAPISKLDYLGGRFVGAMLSMLLVYPAIGLGAFAAAHSHLVDPARLGPERMIGYLWPYVVVLIPNLFVTGALFFSVATLSKRMLPVYVSAVVLLLGYLIALGIANDLQNKTLTALLDPFGLQAGDRLTEYWTVAERNVRLMPLSGVLLGNRLLWCAVGAALLALTCVRFSFSETSGRGAAPPEARDIGATTSLPGPAELDFSARTAIGLFARMTALELRETVKSVVFVVVLLAGALFVIITGGEADQLYGTRTWPVTYEVLEILGGSFSLFVIVIVAFYSGELVWRERDAGVAPIIDALPTRLGLAFASKLVALLSIVAILLVVLMAAGMGLQMAKGYFELEPGLYLKQLFLVQYPGFATLAMFAMFVHVVVNQKQVAHFLVILHFVLAIALPALGFEHHLYRFDSIPRPTYSAMNGYGHFALPIAHFRVYWGALGVAMAAVAHLFWVRGADVGVRFRLRLARARLGRGTTLSLAASLGVFALMGVVIFRNTNVLNTYRTEDAKETLRAEREKRYGAWADKPRPTHTAARLTVDLYPKERRLRVLGTYDLENRTAAPLAQVLLTLPERARITTMSFGRGETPAILDRPRQTLIYDLARPLAPGEKGTLDFDIAYENPGYPNDAPDNHIVENGSFIGWDYLPTIGYARGEELDEDEPRRKHGLSPKHMKKQDDPSGLAENYVGADFIDFGATFGTADDQMPITSGTLERTWTENGRRYSHFRLSQPALGLVAFLSGRYAVLRDKWNDVDIEIDYHPGHTYDLDRMVRATKASLEYFTKNFSPYQNTMVRIVEFPRYEQLAQSLPTTIPFSESIGFIARVDDRKKDEVDYPLYVTAHEVGHQWWAHQLVGADVQGSTVLSETLAQYSALMVMKHAFAPHAMKKYLRYELERYLRGRANARKAEVPLALVENQGYIHYSKGTLVMYAMQDLIGEDAVNRVLADLLHAHSRKGPPYPISSDLVRRLLAVTPEAQRRTVDELWNTITLFENRAVKATSHARPDGKYEVTMTLVARKVRANEIGAETEVPMDDHVDVGVLDADGVPLALEKRRIDRNELEVVMVVDKAPAEAGIDPLNKLIDRKPEDNVVKVEAR